MLSAICPSNESKERDEVEVNKMFHLKETTTQLRYYDNPAPLLLLTGPSLRRRRLLEGGGVGGRVLQ